jgi:hypothetical protein
MNPPRYLNQFEKNIHSQSGEDGIIEKILETIPPGENWVVEFGASDGLFKSNSRRMITDWLWQAVLIESGKEAFNCLQANYASHSGMVKIFHRMVKPTGPDSLDNILLETDCPPDFTLLSIDVDGDDLPIWEGVNLYKPRIVCIEFNCTMPNEIVYKAQPNDGGCGSSLFSIVGSAKERGYELVAVTLFNAIFVRSEFYPLFELATNNLWYMRPVVPYATYMYQSMDGKIHLVGSSVMPWHSLMMEESRMQNLPKFLRKSRTKYSWLDHKLFKLIQWYRNRKSGISFDAV